MSVCVPKPAASSNQINDNLFTPIRLSGVLVSGASGKWSGKTVNAGHIGHAAQGELGVFGTEIASALPVFTEESFPDLFEILSRGLDRIEAGETRPLR